METNLPLLNGLRNHRFQPFEQSGTVRFRHIIGAQLRFEFMQIAQFCALVNIQSFP